MRCIPRTRTADDRAFGMSSQSDIAQPHPRRGTKMKAVLGAAAFIVLIGAMALDTKVVVIGSGEDVSERAFSPEQFGREMFPQIRESVMGRAVDAVTLAEAIAADKAAAGEQYGVKGGCGPANPAQSTVGAVVAHHSAVSGN